MAAVAISNILYTNLHSFFPLYMLKNFPGMLSSMHFGVILAIFEVSNMIISLILGKYIGIIKRKDLIISSYIVLFFGTLLFTFLSYLDSEQYLMFFIISMVLRVIQGAASASI